MLGLNSAYCIVLCFIILCNFIMLHYIYNIYIYNIILYKNVNEEYNMTTTIWYKLWQQFTFYIVCVILYSCLCHAVSYCIVLISLTLLNAGIIIPSVTLTAAYSLTFSPSHLLCICTAMNLPSDALRVSAPCRLNAHTAKNTNINRAAQSSRFSQQHATNTTRTR